MSLEQSTNHLQAEIARDTTISLSSDAMAAISEIQRLQYERDVSEDLVLADSIALHLTIARAVSDGAEILIRNKSTGWRKIDVPRF